MPDPGSEPLFNSESELIARGANWCLCLVCNERWEITEFTDPGPNGHGYGKPCPCQGPPRPVFIPEVIGNA